MQKIIILIEARGKKKIEKENCLCQITKAKIVQFKATCLVFLVFASGVDNCFIQFHYRFIKVRRIDSLYRFSLSR